MNRADAIREVVARHADAAIVFSNGRTAREAAHVADRPGNLYLHHAMGEALAVAIGLASGAPGLPVVVVEGDGNAAMGLAATGLMPVRDITYYVLDNGVYETTGGQPCPRLPFEAPWMHRIEIERGDVDAPVPPAPAEAMRRFRTWLEERLACRSEAS